MFCQWLPYKTVDEPGFLYHVLWTGEVMFLSGGATVFTTYMNGHRRILMILYALNINKD
jgi:hypothetical protein